MTKPNDKQLRLLNDKQREQVRIQWDRMQHDTHTIDLPITPFGDVLKDFRVDKGVWNPEIVSAKYHASWLFHNNERLYSGRYALDMGTGTGLMGIVMARQGANDIVMSDISPLAVENARHNSYKFMPRAFDVLQGDLFEGIRRASVIKEYKFIMFNHPFFVGDPGDDTISASMLASSALIRRFLKQAPDYLAPGGVIAMPFFDLAPNHNNPAIVGPKMGYDVRLAFSANSTQDLHRGKVSIYELRRQQVFSLHPTQGFERGKVSGKVVIYDEK